MQSEGVEKIDTKNKEFDPHIMECIDITQGEENKVVEELRAGYTLHGAVLRPAQVRVGGKQATS